MIFSFTQVRKIQAIKDCGELTAGMVAVIADDDYVTILRSQSYDDPRNPRETYSTSWFDTWRFVDGKADEHWDAATIATP